jgi:hypothetical protein
VRSSWKQLYEKMQKSRARLAELREPAAQAPLATREGVELAGLEEDVGDGAARALALRRELVARDPESPPARFVLARQLLLDGDEAGVALMEAVIQKEPDAILAGSELLRDFWWRRGETESARRWHESAAARARVLQDSRRERERVKVDDTWFAHGLDAATLGALVERLKLISGLQQAYLVRKRVTIGPEVPLYVLGIRAAKLGFTRGSRVRAVIKQLRESVQFPGETLIVDLEPADERFGREFRGLPAARIM